MSLQKLGGSRCRKDSDSIVLYKNNFSPDIILKKKHAKIYLRKLCFLSNEFFFKKGTYYKNIEKHPNQEISRNQSI